MKYSKDTRIQKDNKVVCLSRSRFPRQGKVNNYTTGKILLM